MLGQHTPKHGRLVPRARGLSPPSRPATGTTVSSDPSLWPGALPCPYTTRETLCVHDIVSLSCRCCLGALNPAPLLPTLLTLPCGVMGAAGE